MARSLNRKTARFLALASVAALLAATAGLAQPCEDLDEDGYFSVVGCGSERDVNDDDALAFPGAPERCNGVDDDGDRLVDEDAGCVRTCANPEVIGPWMEIAPDGRGFDPDVVFTGDGWVVTYRAELDDGSRCDALYAARLDLSGNVVLGPVVLSGGPSERVDIGDPTLVWTGARLALTWEESPQAATGCQSFPTSPRALFQQLSADLEPDGPRVELGPCEGGPSQNTTGRPRAAWNGAVYGLTWYEAAFPDETRVSVLDRSGEGTICGESFAVDETAPYTKPSWNGETFGTAYNGCPPPSEGDCASGEVGLEVYFQRFDDTARVSASTRITADTERSLLPWVAGTDSGWSLVWQDDRQSTTFHEIWSSSVDDHGVEREPGDTRLTFGNDDGDPEQRENPQVVWTGEEFGVVYDERRGPLGFAQVGRFERMAPDGTAIGAGVTLGDGASVRVSGIRVARGAGEYGVAFVSDGAPWFARIGCECTDADGDLFSTCRGQDCNDADPSVNPAAAEACLSGADENCDGLIDCQDVAICPAGGGSEPGPVSGVAFAADGTTLTWTPRGDATSYDVLTGDVADLRASGSFAGAQCGAWRLPEPSWVTDDSPANGRASWFLVRGKADTCLLGTWGSPARDEARLVCP